MGSPGVRPTFGSHSHTVASCLGLCGPQARLGPSLKRQPLLPNKVAVTWALGLPLPRRHMRGRPPSPAGSLQKKVPLERLLLLQLRVPSQISPRSSYTAAGRPSSTDCSGPKGPGAEGSLSTRL